MTCGPDTSSTPAASSSTAKPTVYTTENRYRFHAARASGTSYAELSAFINARTPVDADHNAVPMPIDSRPPCWEASTLRITSSITLNASGGNAISACSSTQSKNSGTCRNPSRETKKSRNGKRANSMWYASAAAYVTMSSSIYSRTTSGTTFSTRTLPMSGNLIRRAPDGAQPARRSTAPRASPAPRRSCPPRYRANPASGPARTTGATHR